MGEAEGSRRGYPDEQEHSLLAGGTLSSRREHVQSQDGIYSLRKSYRTHRVSCESEHRTVFSRIYGSSHISQEDERMLAVPLSSDDHD